jgi:hypothetical protein
MLLRYIDVYMNEAAERERGGGEGRGGSSTSKALRHP